MSAQNPILQRRIFWDVAYDSLDYTADAAFIIERVFERGDVADIRQISACYGDARIAEVMTRLRWLPKRTVYLCAAIFDLPLTSFQCYIIAQSNPQHWTY